MNPQEKRRATLQASADRRAAHREAQRERDERRAAILCAADLTPDATFPSSSTPKGHVINPAWEGYGLVTLCGQGTRTSPPISTDVTHLPPCKACARVARRYPTPNPERTPAP